MSVHDSPLTVLAAEDARHPDRDGDQLGATADPRAGPSISTVYASSGVTTVEMFSKRHSLPEPAERAPLRSASIRQELKLLGDVSV